MKAAGCLGRIRHGELVLGATLLAAVTTVLGCGGAGTSTTAPSPTASAHPTSPVVTVPPQPSPTATPTLVPLRNHELAARTGIADVDRVLDAIMAGTPGALAPLLKYESVPCIEQPPNQGNRHPLLCGEGMKPGDLLTGLWFYGVEGGLAPAADAPAALNDILSRRLYGVFRYLPPQPAGIAERDYGIVFLDVSAFYYRFLAVDVKDGRIVSVSTFPDWTLMHRPDDPAWVLPPIEVPPP